MSYGSGAYGLIPFGSTPILGPSAVREIGDFQFNVKAKSEGYTIRIEWSVPLVSDAPTWTRRIKILRKKGEWPQSYDDSGASIVIDDVYPAIAEDYFIDQTGLEAGVIYYYALFAERNDGNWISDKIANRDSAYPYDRWGFVEYMYDSLPRGYRSEDVDVQHLYQFLSVIGAIFDNSKTDIENLLTLFSIDEVHDDLIYLMDRKVGWPTWHDANGLKRREDAAEAVDFYKIKGRAAAYDQLLSGISSWDLTVVEGWKYVLFTNGLYNSTIVDTTNPDTIRLMGRIDDINKYINDSNGWHSVSGLGFFLEEIPGVSGPITSSMIERSFELIEWSKASYVTYGLIFTPVSEEEIAATDITDEYEDIYGYLYGSTIEELSYETSDLGLFVTNDLTKTTNTLTDRIFHPDINYI